VMAERRDATHARALRQVHRAQHGQSSLRAPLAALAWPGRRGERARPVAGGRGRQASRAGGGPLADPWRQAQRRPAGAKASADRREGTMEARQGRDARGGSVRSTTARPGPGRVTLRPGSHPSLQPCAAGPGAAESACANWAAGPSGSAPAQRPPARCTVHAAQVFQPPALARRESYVGGVAWPPTRLTTDEAAGSRSQVLRRAAADDDAANPLASLGQFPAASGNCPQNLWVNPHPQALEARPGAGLGSVPNCAAVEVDGVLGACARQLPTALPAVSVARAAGALAHAGHGRHRLNRSRTSEMTRGHKLSKAASRIALPHHPVG
jgi:hypothetical protein